MPIEISNFFSDINTSMFNIIGLNRIFTSVIYTSLLISVIVMIIVLFLYPYKKSTPSYLFIKSFLYITMAVTIILALHSSFIRTYYRAKSQDTELNSFVDRVGGNNHSEDSVPIVPSQVISDNQQDIDDDIGEIMPEKNKTVSEMLDSINL